MGIYNRKPFVRKGNRQFLEQKPTEKVQIQNALSCILLHGTVAVTIVLQYQYGKLQIACCDWLPERARWKYLACSELPACVPREKPPQKANNKFLLTKLFESRWLYISLILFFCYFMSVSVHKHAKKKTRPISSHLDLRLSQ